MNSEASAPYGKWSCKP